MKLHKLSILCIMSCLVVNATESNDVALDNHIYDVGEYSAEDYEQYPAYREIVDSALARGKNGPPMLAYILQEQSYVVCIFADAFGRLIYTAECYQLIDAAHFSKIGEIRYHNTRDFDVPKLSGGYLHVRSKRGGASLAFDIHGESLYAEDVDE